MTAKELEREEEIQRHMLKLNLSREGAEQLWQDDQDDFMDEEMLEMEKKAKEVMRTIHGASSDIRERKVVVKEKKLDPIKVNITEYLLECLKNYEGVVNLDNFNPGKMIKFSIGEGNFTIDLSKSRNKKNK